MLLVATRSHNLVLHCHACSYPLSESAVTRNTDPLLRARPHVTFPGFCSKCMHASSARFLFFMYSVENAHNFDCKVNYSVPQAPRGIPSLQSSTNLVLYSAHMLSKSRTLFSVRHSSSRGSSNLHGVKLHRAVIDHRLTPPHDRNVHCQPNPLQPPPVPVLL